MAPPYSSRCCCCCCCCSPALPRPRRCSRPCTACARSWTGSAGGEAPPWPSSCPTSTRKPRCWRPATSRHGLSSPSLTSTKFKSPKGSSAELRFGEYTIPNRGENLLESLEFRNEELYSVGKPMEEVFWLPVDSAWLKIAEQLKVKLERCNDTFCLSTTPKVVYGLKGSSADIFLDNAAYREFLFREFGASTVDEESAAVVMTATSTGVPVIVFRGVSDLAGGEPTRSSTSLLNLASINALKVAVEFIATVGK